MPTTHTPHLWQVGVYLRLSKEDARRESASIANQRAILLDYLNHEFQDPWTLTQVYTDATVIIGLKQNPTYGRRFSPIFLLYWAFCGAKRKMLR